MRNENPVRLTPAPAGYADWLGDIKRQIHEAQQRAAQALNLHLVTLYWKIGRAILDQQEQQGWGAKIIDRLAEDLRTNFPEMKGFSPRNLKYMRTFAEAWMEFGISATAAGQIALGSPLRPSRQTQNQGGSRVVSAESHRAQLVAQHPRHADRTRTRGR